MEKLKELVTIRMSKELLETIDQVAAALDLTRSRLIKTAVGEYIDYCKRFRIPEAEQSEVTQNEKIV